MTGLAPSRVLSTMLAKFGLEEELTRRDQRGVLYDEVASNSDFHEAIQDAADCWPCRHKKITCAVGQISGFTSRHPAPPEGRMRYRHDTRSGMRWTLSGITRRVTRLADGEVVWSRPPDAGVKLVDEFTSDGG